MIRQILLGAAAGAAGATALNAVTYLDMALRTRPASDTPERTAERLSELAHLPLPDDPQKRAARLTAIGALAGIGTGAGVGAAYGLLQGAGIRLPVKAGSAVVTAMVLVAANGPMVLLGITDPRTWRPVDWAADLVPHAAFGAVTAAVYGAATRADRPWWRRAAPPVAAVRRRARRR
ncbi:MAG TPA: hypothetical protein VGI84_04540 [Pseudonocardiaceae bacterium]